MPRIVPVDLPGREYDIHIGPGLVQNLGQLAAETSPSQAAVITDSHVAPLHADAAVRSLAQAGLPTWQAVPFLAGEPSKTLDTASELLDELLSHEPAIDRKTLVVALGGGVVGDMAGFVAAITLRGLGVLQVPTTLLAAVDSSVGGKTGVDHPAGKNLIGAFHQPAAVCIDVDLLRTLPLAELRNGLAECVKHGVIRDADLLDVIDAHAENLQSGQDGALSFDAETMSELIARNVAIKAAVVAEDEREAGVRAHLNFGHTVGHAVETHIGYASIRHGEAVALGMVAANAIAVQRGLLARDAADRVRDLLNRLNLPTRAPDLDADAIWQIMQHDKKARGGKVRFVLAERLGQVDIYDDVTHADVRSALDALQ